MNQPRGDRVSDRTEWLSDEQRKAFRTVMLILGPLLVLGVGSVGYQVWPTNGGSAQAVAGVLASLLLLAASGFVLGRRFRVREREDRGGFSLGTMAILVLGPAAGIALSRLVGSTATARLVLGSLSLAFLLWTFCFVTGLNWGRLTHGSLFRRR